WWVSKVPFTAFLLVIGVQRRAYRRGCGSYVLRCGWFVLRGGPRGGGCGLRASVGRLEGWVVVWCVAGVGHFSVFRSPLGVLATRREAGWAVDERGTVAADESAEPGRVVDLVAVDAAQVRVRAVLAAVVSGEPAGDAVGEAGHGVS